jgi:tRNA U34 5-methylaminomethyl-2-thiouridine-forming methyltransferase MnmC
MEIEQITTADGSHTLFLPAINEHYHSVNGAIQESQHVYIQSGFNQCPKDSIQVLEMGFGTGLNALLTALEARKRKIAVYYTALEKFPLPDTITNRLNYSGLDKELFEKIHCVEWETPVLIPPYFTLYKKETGFSDFEFPGFYDVVYYDAFAPDKQPEVWTQALFDQIYAHLHPDGILTTYCAKGAVRRMMQQAGFTVERIPGPPGKREMLRAGK